MLRIKEFSFNETKINQGYVKFYIKDINGKDIELDNEFSLHPLDNFDISFIVDREVDDKDESMFLYLKNKVEKFIEFQNSYNDLRQSMEIYSEFGADDTAVRDILLKHIANVLYTDRPIAADKIDWGLYCNDDNRYDRKLAEKDLSKSFNKLQDAILDIDKEDKPALYDYIEKNYAVIKWPEQKSEYIYGYHHLGEAEYKDAVKKHGYKYNDDIMIGLYSPDGGTKGEFKIIWKDLGDKNVPMIRAYDDSWQVLAESQKLLKALAKTKEPTPEEVKDILNDLGYQNLTKKGVETEDESVSLKP